MKLAGADLRLSPSDLSAFLGCRHRTGLDLAVAAGALQRPTWSDPMAQALRDRGAEHERAYVAHLRADGREIVEIDQQQPSDARVRQTIDAMRGGAEAIVQAALASGAWLGYADILQRVPVPSTLGAWSYEPYDTKLARETRGGTILQLAVYADLLLEIQGVCPDRFWVVAPGNAEPPFMVTAYRYAEVAAYVRTVRRQLGEALGLGHEAIRDANYPEPVEGCDVCRWADRCEARRRKDDHLSFIAGIARVHREELTAQGYPTLAAAAAMALPVPFAPSRGSRETYERIREQARVQHQQRTSRQPVHELLLPVAEGKGLARLPEPSAGDLFLDLEGARFAREGGREYLFGLWRLAGGEGGQSYEGLWAWNDAEEKLAFEAVMERIIRALAAHPGAHVYHFGHYEPSAFKRLMGRHATRATELDELLRGERFVDLHAVVRQALRAGVESYSIKQLEQFYRFSRAMPLRDASAHLQAIELALESNAPAQIPDEAREAVCAYNRDDCRSTQALRDWLERLRADLQAEGTAVPRPALKEQDAPDPVSELEQRQQAARERLLEGLPPEAAAPEHPEHARWLLAHEVDWHRRELKSEWWEYYRLRDLPDSDLFDEPDGIAGLTFVERMDLMRGKSGKLTGSVVDRYRYPEQEVEIGRKGNLEVAGGGRFGAIVAHDRVARTIDVKKGNSNADVHPTAAFQYEVITTNLQQEALLRFVQRENDVTCGTDLLFRRTPRLSAGAFRQPVEGESLVEFAVNLAAVLDRTTLAVQGPPGSGKTYLGAQMIRALVRAGKTVGVTANSHKVIRNLLEAIAKQDAGRAPATRLGHRRSEGEPEEDSTPIRMFSRKARNGDLDARDALTSGEVDVLGGTHFFWSREEADNLVDVLFVDEAGQMSLANALAVSGAARSLVLLGDPQQLEQPQKGTHPDGVGVSALEHVLGGAATMPPDRGLFLPTTWRLHPSICTFTSELFYEGKLHPRAGLERQALTGTGAFDGAGLWWVPVAHAGSQNASMDEVDEVERIVDRLLVPGAGWVDADGVARALTASDLRVVAPYNAQVNRLTERLGLRGVPVGTVDKFQGQEAPVVIYSMAASRAEDAPRGMEFLYSLNRLNVATSRARCAAIVVASPALLEPACRTPRQMRLANALCRYGEMAFRKAELQFGHPEVVRP